ncbi:MAG: flavodoxin [Eubacteriales bacterium]|nr:flavodoxin [Eubacteriales bacterium]
MKKRKKLIILGIAVILVAAGIFFLVNGSGSNPNVSQAEPSKKNTETAEVPHKDKKTLIVYFSWSTSGNTKKMASYIQKQTKGDLLEIKPLNPYPTDYEKCGEVARVERDENARPEIADLPDSIEEYDTVFIGYPIWWHTAPMIIGTFLENYDLSGVEVYPFAQSASMDKEQFENSMKFVRKSAAGANVHDGLFTEASDRSGMLAYLKENGFVE